MASNDGEKVVGCAISVFSLIVTNPMWLVLLFALMRANEMPQWSWVLYWCYVPASVMGVLVAAVAKQLLAD